MAPELSPTRPPACRLATLATADVADRHRVRDHTLVDADQPAERGAAAFAVDAAGAGRAGDIAGRERIADDAAVETDEPAGGAVGADGDIPGRKRKGDGAEVSPTRPPADTCWHELLNAQPWPPLSTLAVAITSPLADEPKMLEPGALNPTSPPNATLMPALLTVDVRVRADDLSRDGRRNRSRPLAPTSPPSAASVAVPPSTVPVAVTPLTVPRLVPASVPTVWNVTPGLAVTSTFARLRSRTTPRLPMTPNSPTLWVVELAWCDVRLAMVWPWPSNTPVNTGWARSSGSSRHREMRCVRARARSCRLGSCARR